MTKCSMGDLCETPLCRGASWRADSAAPANVALFTADVVSFMKATGRRDVGKCAAEVFARAKREACLFE